MQKNLKEIIIEDVERKILTEQLKVGDKLPTLRQMVQDYKISRSVINSAVVELKSKGLIKIKPRHGMVVSDWKKEGTLAVFSAMAKWKLFDKDSINSLFQGRRLIELESVALAIKNSSNTKSLLKALDKGLNVTTIEEKIEYDRNFHHTIAVISGNMVYPMILKSFEMFTSLFLESFFESEQNYMFVRDYHKKIVDAIINKNKTKAVVYMKELLEHGEKAILN